jgi:hypothetical protein
MRPLSAARVGTVVERFVETAIEAPFHAILDG